MLADARARGFKDFTEELSGVFDVGECGNDVAFSLSFDSTRAGAPFQENFQLFQFFQNIQKTVLVATSRAGCEDVWRFHDPW